MLYIAPDKLVFDENLRWYWLFLRVCCDGSLEPSHRDGSPSHRDGSNEGSQCMFTKHVSNEK